MSYSAVLNLDIVSSFEHGKPADKSGRQYRRDKCGEFESPREPESIYVGIVVVKPVITTLETESIVGEYRKCHQQ